MAIKISGIYAEECGTGLLIEGAFAEGLDVTDVKTVGCINGVVTRDKPTLISQIGLPENTPPNVLIEVLETLRSMETSTEKEKANVVKDSIIAPYLAVAADATTVISNLIQISSSPIVMQVITALSS